MTPEEIRKAREDLDREYEKLPWITACFFVGTLVALLGVFFLLHVLNLLP